MKIVLINRNVEVTEELKEVVEKKLEKLSKYFDDNIETHVLLSKEGYGEKVEATILGVKNTIFRAESQSQDIYGGIDKVVQKLTSQITKYKGRLNKRHKGAEGIRFENIITNEEKQYKEVEQKSFAEEMNVRIKNLNVASMSVEDAIMNMNLVDHDFYIFKNEENNEEFSVVYKRKAGGYGLLKSKE